MNRFIFFLSVFLYGSGIVKAQHTYIPIPEDSALWVVVVENWHEGDPGNPPHTFDYRLTIAEGKDTIVIGKRYLRLLWGYPNGGLPLPVGYNYIGQWIRQDTIAQKVWYIRDKSHPQKEELLYDFSLQAGDTITDTLSSYFNPKNLYPYKAWIDHIDSVFWADGTWRYRWFITSDYGPDWGKPSAQAVQIEGMGYTTDFLDDPWLRYHPLVSTTIEVVCFRHNGLWLYHQANPWNADCDTMITRDILAPNGITTMSRELEQPLLYPNPVAADGGLFLNSYAGNSNEAYQINAYNIEGRRVLSLTARPGTSISLVSYSLTPGLYFFRCSNKQGNVIHRQRVIVR